MFALFNVRLLYVLIPVGLVAAAAALPNLDLVASPEGCAATEERPCYDQGTKKKTKILKGNAGENAFTACMENAEEGRSGVVAMETPVCAEEVVTYCFVGNSDNFIRQFDGTCQAEPPAPEPPPEEVTLNGTFVNGVTGDPVANVSIWDEAVGMNTTIAESDASGDFVFDVDTTDISESSSYETSFTTGCYFQNWGFTDISRNGDDSLRLMAILFDFEPGDLVEDPLTDEQFDLGDIPLWPATTLLLAADVPVQVRVAYPEENKMLKNTSFRTEHKIWNAIPLEQPTTVELIDQNGTVYESPELTLPIDNGCTAARLEFSNGQMTWR